jgi:hypothetical protein
LKNSVPKFRAFLKGSAMQFVKCPKNYLGS